MKPSTPLPVAAYDIDQARASKDKFLYAGAPQWLKDAPLERLKPLHDALLANEQSLKAIDQATQGLLSPQQFAEQQFKPLVHKLLPQGPGLDALEWVDTHYVPGPLLTTPFLEPQYTHTAAADAELF
jgi:inactivated superfamily I helicase